MYRLHLLILLSFLGASALWAQDAETETEPTEPSVEEPDNEVTDEEIDELLGLDEDYSEIEDEEFDFSEDVRFEQSTDFPVDI